MRGDELSLMDPFEAFAGNIIPQSRYEQQKCGPVFITVEANEIGWSLFGWADWAPILVESHRLSNMV